MKTHTQEKQVRCKESVFERGCWGGRSCLRLAVKDGYCNQHHPDAEKARKEKSDRLWEEKRSRDPLKIALQKIATLEQQRDDLIGTLTEIAEWVDRYTSPNHPVSTIARKAIAKVTP